MHVGQDKTGPTPWGPDLSAARYKMARLGEADTSNHHYHIGSPLSSGATAFQSLTSHKQMACGACNYLTNQAQPPVLHHSSDASLRVHHRLDCMLPNDESRSFETCDLLVDVDLHLVRVLPNIHLSSIDHLSSTGAQPESHAPGKRVGLLGRCGVARCAARCGVARC